MKLAGIPKSVFLILFAAVIIVLKHLLTSIFQHLIQFASSPLLLFSLLNTILVAIMVGSYRPCTCQDDEILSFFNYAHELAADTRDSIEETSDEDDNYDDEYHGSDGYNEDDDDNGSDGEVGWEEEEGFEDNLRKRIEDFIAKNNNTWKEERLRDKHNPS